MKIRRVLVALFMLIPFCLSITVTAFADVPLELASGPLFALWACDLAKNYVDKRVDEVKNMTGDEFYNWYTDKDGIESNLWRGFNRLYSLESRYGGGYPYGSPFNVAIPTESEVELEKSHYSAAFIDQSFLNYIDDQARTVVNSGIRYTTLDEIHISTADLINTSNIDVITFNSNDTQPVINHGSKWKATTTFDIYYDISRAKLDTSHVSIYPGGDLPPLVYIPANCTVYQNGVALKQNDFYVVLGDNRLLYTAVTYHPSGYIGFDYYNPTDSTDGVIFECDAVKIDNNQNTTTYGMPITDRRLSSGYIASSGASAGAFNVEPYKGWTLVDMIAKHCNYCLDINGSISQSTALPGYIPYDDEDIIVVLVPEGGGDVVYMNPTDYINYVNNGQIVQGDYINNYDTDTVTDITNNYNNYVTNHSSGGDSGSGTGSGYDDSNVISRLDSIINWLRKIHDKIDLASKTQVINEVFNSDPCYIEFNDCFTDHISLFSDVEDMMSDLDVQTESDGVAEIMEFGGVSTTHNTTDNIKSAYNGLSVNVSWYAPYRVRVRNLLKIPCWILGIIAIWSALKSVFGIHSSS